MSRVEQAVGRFKSGLNCSQAVFCTYSEQFGLDSKTASKAATGFGGGMRMGGTCGAVTGAFMVLGLKYGNATGDEKQAKAKTYEKVVEFAKRFKAQNNSVTCKELLGIDIGEEGGFKKLMESGLHDSVCPKMVKNAAEILEEMLVEDE